MKKQLSIQTIWFLAILLSVISINLQAQLAAGQSKFLGNTHTKGQTPLNFDHYWNQLTPGNGGKWASCEQARDDFNYWLWLDRAYDHAREFGLTFKEHTLIWGSSSGEPSWMSSVPQDEQMDEVLEWYQALSERYPDIELIDVVNEPLHAPPSYTEALGGEGETGWDWVVWCYERAREYFPNATLILNEYNVLNYTSTCQDFLEIINMLNDRGLIDAIGCQAHSLESIDIETIQTNLDLLAATGLDIYISEYEARGDDATQLALFQEQFPVFWEHPSVKGVTLWGYLEGDMWREEAYLLADDGVTERPALQWLKEYFNFTDDTPGPYVMITDTTGVGTVTLSPSGGTYDANTEVTATATPGEGYVFSHWTGDLSGLTNPNTIAMTSNRSLTANFVPEGYIPTYTLDVSVSGNGSVTQSPEGTVFAEGAVVTLTAVPDEDYMFTGWTGTVSSSSTTIEVTMESNTVLTASFAKIPGTGCEGEESISMNFEQNGIGEFCYVAQGELNYFNSWNMDYLEVNGENFTNVWSNTVPASDDGLIHIHYVATVSYAHFEMLGTDGGETYTVEINATEGGSVSSTGGIYPVGSEIEVTATPDAEYEFTGWTGDITSSSTTINITVSSDISITANFEQTEDIYYTLTVDTTGSGSVIPESGTYLEGSEVTLTASPNTGYVFSHWSGDVSGTSNTITVIMDSDKTVVANFIVEEPGPVYFDLVVNIVGDGSVTPSGGTYEAGTIVTLTATPDTNGEFIEWTGDASGTSTIISLAMVSDIEVTANFIVVENSCTVENSTTVSVPFSQDGTGDYCFATTDDISYVNSWNMDLVEINGVDYTNTWSNSMPSKQDGYYFIHYVGSYSWSHFEAAGTKASGSMLSEISEAFPNPFIDKALLHIGNPKIVSGIDIMDQTGRIIESYDVNDILPMMQIGGNLRSGVYYVRIITTYGIQTQIITKR